MIESYLHALNIENLKPLSGFHNTIYEGVHENVPIVIRISDRRTKEDIQAEVDMLNHVKDDVSVAEPYKVDDAYVMEKSGRVFAFFRKVEGLNWHETTLTPKVHYNAGRALGLLHASLETVGDIDRSTYDRHPDIKLLRGVDETYDQMIENVLSTLASYGYPTSEYGLIHGDYLFANLLYRDEDVTIIDFDDMEYGYYLYDIAVYLFYLLLGGDPGAIETKPNIEVFKQFIKGYISANDTTHLDFTKIQTMFRLRQLKLLATIKKKIDAANLGPWQKAYISLCDEQFKEDKDFIDIPYQAIYDDIRKSSE